MEFERILKYAELYLAAAHPRAEYMREYMKNRYHSKRNEVIDHLGGKCSRCGSKDGPLHLDHIDKHKKTMRASDLHSVNDQKFKKEIKNLQILCEKCHREKTKEAWDYSTPKPRHGTYWMARRYGCKCSACQKAYREKQKEWRENKIASDMGITEVDYEINAALDDLDGWDLGRLITELYQNHDDDKLYKLNRAIKNKVKHLDGKLTIDIYADIIQTEFPVTFYRMLKALNDSCFGKLIIDVKSSDPLLIQKFPNEFASGVRFTLIKPSASDD